MISRILLIAAEVLIIDLVMTGIDAYRFERRRALEKMVDDMLEEDE